MLVKLVFVVQNYAYFLRCMPVQLAAVAAGEPALPEQCRATARQWDDFLSLAPWKAFLDTARALDYAALKALIRQHVPARPRAAMSTLP